MFTKHNKNYFKVKCLEKELQEKNEEVDDLKNLLSDTLEQIRYINEANGYASDEVRKRKISEICTDIRYKIWVESEEANGK